jgi:hypothetical protein
MRRPVMVLLCSAAVFAFLSGCNSQLDVASESSPAKEQEQAKDKEGLVPVDQEQAAQEPPTGKKVVPVEQDKETFVFRAKYYRTKGPCIRIGNGWAMPLVDAFEVVEIVKGDLQAKYIEVRALTSGGSGYPKELAEGMVYTLRLTPTDRTMQQLQENQKQGSSFLCVNGEEIEEHQVGQ